MHNPRKAGPRGLRAKLAQARVNNPGQAVRDLQRVVGSTVEEEAASVVEVILRRKGYRILQPSYALPVGSEGEVDVVVPAEEPAGRCGSWWRQRRG